jgi:hypothetical protein
MDGESVGRCETLELICSRTHFKIDMENWSLSNCSTKLFFSQESNDIDLHEISIFCFLSQFLNT